MECKIIRDIFGASRLSPPIVYLISRPSIKRGGASLDVTFSDLGVTLDVRQWCVLDREVLGVLGDPDKRLGRRFVILLLHQQQESIPVGCVPLVQRGRQQHTTKEQYMNCQSRKNHEIWPRSKVSRRQIKPTLSCYKSNIIEGYIYYYIDT